MNNKYHFSESQINGMVGKLRRDFFLFVLVFPILVFLGEREVIPNGLLFDVASLDYFLSVVGVILVLGGVYLSLSMFARQTKNKKVAESHIGGPLQYYRLASVIRLSVLVVVASFNIVAYYLVLNTNSLLMSLLALAALFFCWPTRRLLNAYVAYLNNEGAVNSSTDEVSSEEEHIADIQE